MSEKLDRLERKLARLEKRTQRQRALERKRERKASTRRKILLGALVLHDHGEDVGEWPEPLRRRLDQFLTRSRDRELFGFAPVGGDGSGLPSK